MSVDDRRGEGPTRIAPGRETRWLFRTPRSPSVGFIESPSWWVPNNAPAPAHPKEHRDEQGARGHPA